MSSSRSRASADLFTHSSDRKDTRATGGRAFAEVVPLKRESETRESKEEMAEKDDKRAVTEVVGTRSKGVESISFM